MAVCEASGGLEARRFLPVVLVPPQLGVLQVIEVYGRVCRLQPPPRRCPPSADARRLSRERCLINDFTKRQAPLSKPREGPLLCC